MTSSHYCLSSKTYKSRVFEGFSRLQQNDEFVDMTLAAEGCLVKVHKTLIALASPFLKELLTSVPCTHPVLFLSNISHKALCFILEYVYTGEVNIPNEDIKAFLNAAQAMHITGLENIVIPQTKEATWDSSCERANNVFHKSMPSSAANRASIIINDIQNVQLPIVNRGKIHPTTKEPSLPSTSIYLPPSAAKEHFTRNNTNFDLNSQKTNESSTENVVLPTSSDVPVSGKISQYLSMYVKTEDDNNPNVYEDSNNINALNNIRKENIHTLPMIIEGQDSLYNLQLSNNINNNMITNTDHYSNEQNVVNQSIANAANTSQVDLSSLMNISNTSLIQDNDMAVDISISDLIDSNLAATLNPTNDIAENPVTKKNEAIHLTKYDNVVMQNTGKEIVKDSVVHMANATDLLEGNNEESELENAPDNGFMSKDQMDEVLRKDAESVIYMVSNRGSLQLIMHHYIYNCQFVRNKSKDRRWRCIDYKKLKCPAKFDTQNGVIVNRQPDHCHGNHDAKIYIKVMKRHCFPTIEIAQESIKRKTFMSEREQNIVDTLEIDDDDEEM